MWRESSDGVCGALQWELFSLMYTDRMSLQNGTLQYSGDVLRTSWGKQDGDKMLNRLSGKGHLNSNDHHRRQTFRDKMLSPAQSTHTLVSHLVISTQGSLSYLLSFIPNPFSPFSKWQWGALQITTCISIPQFLSAFQMILHFLQSPHVCSQPSFHSQLPCSSIASLTHSRPWLRPLSCLVSSPVPVASAYRAQLSSGLLR